MNAADLMEKINELNVSLGIEMNKLQQNEKILKRFKIDIEKKKPNTDDILNKINEEIKKLENQKNKYYLEKEDLVKIIDKELSKYED